MLVVGIPQDRIDTARQQLKMHMYLYNYKANDNEVTPPSKKPRVVAQPFEDMYEIEEDDDASGSSVQSPVSNFENRIDMEFKAHFAYTITNVVTSRAIRSVHSGVQCYVGEQLLL